MRLPLGGGGVSTGITFVNVWDPPVPVHVKLKVADGRAPEGRFMIEDARAAMAPLQRPTGMLDAVHPSVALLISHESVTSLPTTYGAALVVSVPLGNGKRVTGTVLVKVFCPPGPIQLSVKARLLFGEVSTIDALPVGSVMDFPLHEPVPS